MNDLNLAPIGGGIDASLTLMNELRMPTCRNRVRLINSAMRLSKLWEEAF
jgi:hypothetical protein